MSDLVERVAKAIAMDLGVQEDGVPYNLDDDLCANYVSQNHADFGRLARAAIAEVLDAMEEPSEGMVARGFDEIEYTGGNGRDAADCWQAMLAQFRKESGL